MRRYVVVEPTGEELEQELAKAVLGKSPFSLRARECLDDLTARRRLPEVVIFQLQVISIHLDDGTFVIARTVNADDTVRFDFEADQVTMTVTGSNEPTAPAP